jgi:hypothetical protein
MFRHTSYDPIIIFINDVEQTVDFVEETITIDGVTTAWTTEDRLRWPDVAQIDAYIAEDVAHVAAMNEVSQTMEALSEALAATELSFSSPEEEAILDTQISGALALYHTLSHPPADATLLAASLAAWKVGLT